MERIRRGYLILLFGCLAVAASTWLLPNPTEARSLALIVPPLAFLAIGLGTLGYLAAGGLPTVLNPAAALAVGLAIYYGVGGALPAFGNEATLDYVQAHFQYTPAEILRTHRIAAVGYAMMALAAFATVRGAATADVTVGRELTPQYLRRVIPRILAVGLGVRLLLELPWQFGISHAPPSQSVTQFGMLATLGMVLAGFGLARRMIPWKSWFPIFVASAAVLLLTSLLTFSKQAFLTEVVGVFAGFILAKPSRALVISAAVVVAAVYAVSQPLVAAVRQLGIADQASTVAERVEAVRTTADVGADILGAEADPVNLAWARLSLNPLMAFVIHERDERRPGNTILQNALWMLVPRFAWPGKPVLSTIGAEFNVLVTGSPESQVTAGYLGEAYWNGGYPGLLLVASWVGLLLGCLTRIAVGGLSSLDVPALFVLGMGLQWGVRAETWFALSFVGGLANFLFGYALLVLFTGRHALQGDTLRSGTGELAGPKRNLAQSASALPPRGTRQ